MIHNTPFQGDRGTRITRARGDLRPDRSNWFPKSPEAEGGCGVTGFACSIPVSGKNIYEPSIQMRNRGNGKGGGIAACGLVPEELGVSREVLDESYILQVALLDADARGEVEKEFVNPCFDVQHTCMLDTVDDYRDIPLLDIKPPDVMRYFVRVKPDVLQKFNEEKKLDFLSPRELEDEFVFQNSNRLNEKFYASLGEKRAFVLSHARNLLVLKIVGYAEAVVQYYQMADTKAHVWIAHQRYPTRGRVWHPGGCHPFIGMNEALVHNGDFANYRAVCEFLAQRNLYPQFLTDTETSVMLFDLMARTYKYPMECLIEALAPTSELDFDRLSPEKQRLYREIQTVHTHAAPDGPWFFIIARSLAEKGFQLVGITDTAMLRPQVFALQEGEVSIGLVCSEKQAIDAALANLASEDSRFTPVADKYWNARGGSYTDGGAFLMSVVPKEGGGYDLVTTNKFGDPLHTNPEQKHCDLSVEVVRPNEADDYAGEIEQILESSGADCLYGYLRERIVDTDYDWLRWVVNEFASAAVERDPLLGIEAITMCMDRRYPTGSKKRSSVLTILRQGLQVIFDAQPLFTTNGSSMCRRIDFETKDAMRGPESGEQAILIDAGGFQPEGRDCDAFLSVDAYNAGWRHIVHYNSRGTRFHGSGFGPASDGLRIDCYDNPGDYLASGMDGLEIYVHGNAQDQLCQISKRGKLAVFGDVGQTFMYGAKGGDVYVMGNAAGRPMINAVGRPKVVINGTALDFLAESFMAGDPLQGGGFAIVNGLQVNDDGTVVPLDLPYPGSNLLSLASGGAIYVRDPHYTLVEEQLNAGMFRRLSNDDWKLILPYLKENERLFDIQVERDLLTVDGTLREPSDVYRKVMPHSDEEIEMELEGLGE